MIRPCFQTLFPYPFLSLSSARAQSLWRRCSACASLKAMMAGLMAGRSGSSLYWLSHTTQGYHTRRCHGGEAVVDWSWQLWRVGIRSWTLPASRSVAPPLASLPEENSRQSAWPRGNPGIGFSNPCCAPAEAQLGVLGTVIAPTSRMSTRILHGSPCSKKPAHRSGRRSCIRMLRDGQRVPFLS